MFSNGGCRFFSPFSLCAGSSTLNPGWVEDEVGAHVNSLFSIQVDRDLACRIPRAWGRLAARRTSPLCLLPHVVPGLSALRDSPPWPCSKVGRFALGLPAAWAGASWRAHSS